MIHVRPPLALLVVLCVCCCGRARQPAATQPAQWPVVTLIDAGAEPRQPLRFRAQIGASETLDTTMRVSLRQTVDGTVFPKQKLPLIQVTLEIVVTDVTEEGDIRYEFAYTKADAIGEHGVPPMLVDVTRGPLGSLVGLRGTGVTTDRGFARRAEIKVPAGGASRLLQWHVEKMRQSLEQMTPPFPAEPVGLGATWQVMTTTRQGEFTVRQTALVTLAAAAGDRIELDIEITQDAQPQELRTPGLPPIFLSSLKSQGRGKTLLRLDHLMPLFSEFDMVVDTTSTATITDVEQETQQHTEMTFRLEGRAKRPAPATRPTSTTTATSASSTCSRSWPTGGRARDRRSQRRWRHGFGGSHTPTLRVGRGWVPVADRHGESDGTAASGLASLNFYHRRAA